MKATAKWMDLNSREAIAPRSGCAFLSNYTAEYQEWGDGPPLVLVPGLAGGIALIDPLATALAKHFHVISYKLRGEGDCFALRRGFDLDDLVQDLAEFIDLMCLERPILAGVSLGGVLALEYAARSPGRLSALSAFGIDVRFEPSLLRQVAGHVLAAYPLPTNSPFVNQFFNLLFGSKQKDRVLFDFVTRECWETDQSIIAHRFQLAEHFDLGDRLSQIDVPTLLVTGDRDLLVSHSGLKELQQGIPHAQLATIAGAGHLAFVTHPEEIANQVYQFACKAQLVEV